MQWLSAPVQLARLPKSRHGELYVLHLFLFFNDSCQTNYLEIYPTDLRQTVGFGRTTAVDDQSEISFSIPQETLPWQPNFVGFIDRTVLVHAFRWTQAASDAARRANDGLRSASSLLCCLVTSVTARRGLCFDPHLSVCLTVSTVTHKLMYGFSWNLMHEPFYYSYG